MITNKILVYNASVGLMEEKEYPFTLPSVDILKQSKKSEIDNACNNEILNGTEFGFLSSLGYYVYDAKEDLGNYQVALAAMQAQGMTQRTIKVKDPIDPYKIVSEAQLKTIIGELSIQGDNLFLKKFNLKNQADAITQADYEAAYNNGVSAALVNLDLANALPETTDEEKSIKAVAITNATEVLNSVKLKTDYLFENINW